MVKEVDYTRIDPEFYRNNAERLSGSALGFPKGSFERLALAALGGLCMGVCEILEQLQKKGDDDGE